MHRFFKIPKTAAILRSVGIFAGSVTESFIFVSKKANQVQLPQFVSCINALTQNIDVYGGLEFLNISKFDNAINENITKYNWCS